MLSDTTGLSSERRQEARLAGGRFPLLAPAAAAIVDCGARGLGIETSSHLAVGSLANVSLFVPTGELELLGRVCWARMVGSRELEGGDSEPIFRVGLSFVEGQSFDDWDRLRARLTSGGNAESRRRPRRKIVRWRRPRAS